ncbi:anthranilate synthase component II [Cellulomonas xiejunii]|uniref:Aminodeoxychorismate/anthranilate synthase component II n=1 Tax=Cellulomonas xiejunii TaxID=2968083 RepID=A0ABY5KPA8_9CELL|nr:aminodeoxychorismate/anthranilate synthase component II [Cellulomonas xiejunii]MCC2322159.1 aminodeoxychorismate/anthranilate synthase component II [Cellulomonas xiejunii]MCC2323198.1 aminodeoxychorismate/anthranilate synthase component II [Cellulomonas xiejunii]UUI72215.1 aminodeoxychorismate/anthranilate synthase component II [Cellulomonas xiejunii]
MSARLVVIDNYDSFTFNLVQMFRRYDLDVAVFRADALSVQDVAQEAPDYVLVSPGPRAPRDAGISTDLVRRLHDQVPILGVCLGMQCIVEALGGSTVHAPVPMHGKTSRVHHDGTGLFAGVPEALTVARYHSLATTGFADELRVNARSEDGVAMGVQHVRHPLSGVQFHPESFLTEHGFTLIENFLRTGPLAGSLP